MKRKLIIALSILLILIAGGFLYFKSQTYELVINQNQIDEALEAQFPISKSFLIIFNVTFANPEVTLLEDSDRIRIRMDAELDSKIAGQEKKFGGHCEIVTGIRYDSEQKAFYLANAEFQNLEMKGVPQEHLEKVTGFVSKSASHLVDHFPVYRLEATNAKTTAAKWLLRDLQIEDQAINITLGL